MKMRRLAAMLMAGVMLFTVGCTGNKAKEDSTGESLEETTESDSGTNAAETENVFGLDEDVTDLVIEEFNALECVELGEYKGVPVAIPSTEVTDEDVLKALNDNLYNYRAEVTDRGVEEGDVVDIDFEGKLDGVAFEGGSGQGTLLEIGSNTFIEGFEEGLVGVTAGETVDLNMTFPEEYSMNEELAGKDVVFTVTVNAIKALPEVTDELITEVAGEEITVEKYKEQLKAELTTKKESSANDDMREAAWVQAVGNAVIVKYPETLVKYYAANLRDQIQYYADMYGMDVLEYAQYAGIGEDEEAYVTYINQRGYIMARQVLVLEAIAEQEGLEITEEEFNEGIAVYATESGYTDVDTFLSDIGEEAARSGILYEKVIQFLLDNADIQ